MNKKEAIALLNNEGWTKTDAQRALKLLDFKLNLEFDELTIRQAASKFAGVQLYERQRLQAAQKGMVTKKKDLNDYLKYDRWRFINGDGECGTTEESRAWVQEHSDWYCPICSENYRDRGGKTIDRKLPRSQYPWLSLEWSNLWIICRQCNREKGEKNWYEYEQYIYERYPIDDSHR